MSEPYLGEIRMFAGMFAPQSYLFCQGQTLSIADYEALYTLLGTTYGGDGQTTFNLPDLRGRLPIHSGTATSGGTYTPGMSGGVESVTLTSLQLPVHNHLMMANNNGNSATATAPNNATLGNTSGNGTKVYGTGGTTATFSGKAIGSAGGNASHSNIKPFLSINFIIAVFGVYPTQS